MAKFCKYSLSTLFVTILVFGCTPKAIIEFYNNTEEILTIEGCNNTTTSVYPKKFVTIQLYDCAEQVIVKRPNRSSQYNIRKLIHYEVSNAYYNSHRWNHFNVGIYLRLQFNPDHNIFILPKGMDFPAKADIQQPNSFPLQPESYEIELK